MRTPCFILLLFYFYFSFIAVVRSALEVCSRRGAILIHFYLYLTFVQCRLPSCSRSSLAVKSVCTCIRRRQSSRCQYACQWCANVARLSASIADMNDWTKARLERKTGWGAPHYMARLNRSKQTLCGWAPVSSWTRISIRNVPLLSAMLSRVTVKNIGGVFWDTAV